jgi:N-acetylglucosamine kinase-like BadF-type ATPase
MRYVIGVDQGNSKTWAAVADETGQILGTGLSGGGYATRRMAEAKQTIRESVGQALAQAGLQSHQVNVLYGGISSVDWPDDYEFVRQHVAAEGLADQVYVTNDTIVGLRGGTSAAYGAIIVAGSGANCGIRSPGGETFLYHYYVESELQGGQALGRRVLKTIYRAEHGRERPTALTGEVLTRFGLATVDDLLRADCEGRVPPEQVKQLAPLLFVVAESGDEVAQGILRSFGHGLAEMVTAGLRRMKMTQLPVEVVVSGSVFKGQGSLLEETILADIRQVAPEAYLVNARYEPVVGGVLLALEQLGVTVDRPVKAAIEASSQQWGLIRTKEKTYGSD